MTPLRCVLIPLLLVCSILPAQNLRSYKTAGDKAFAQNDFNSALQYYHTFLSKNPDDPLVLWRTAESARLIASYSEAERMYLTLLNQERAARKYPLLLLRLANVKYGQGEYEEALEYSQRFLSYLSPEDKDLRAAGEKLITACNNAQRLASPPPMAKVENLGKNINSAYSDFAPFMVGDTLFYSSYRFERKGQKTRPKDFITKVMMSVKDARGREPGRGFATSDSTHIAHTAFSPDGHYVFYTVCNNTTVSTIKCALWLIVIDRRNRWLPPIRLPEPVNLPGYTTTHPNVAYDSLTQELNLFFTSDRPGGIGNMDIWKVPLDTLFFCPCALPVPGKKIHGLPKFRQPENVKAINTPGNEGTPFFHNPTQTLYFASDTWPGLGGYDMFAHRPEGEPLNLGIGVNSSYNDLYLFIKNNGREGYLSSNRPGALFLDEKNKFCCNDLYKVDFSIPVENGFRRLEKSTPTIPTLVASPPPPPLPDSTTTDRVKGISKKLSLPDLTSFIGLPLYFDNDQPDPHTNSTTTSLRYGKTLEQYRTQQPVYRKNALTIYNREHADSTQQRIDRFFQNEVEAGNNRFQQLCESLVARLESGDSIAIYVKGYASPRAPSLYNLNLGKRRVACLINEISHYASGALTPYMQNHKLKIVEISYGEQRANTHVDDGSKSEIHSIYSLEAARERRVEIIEIITSK